MDKQYGIAAAAVILLATAGCDCGSGSGSDTGTDMTTGTDAGTDAFVFDFDAGPPLGAGQDPTVPAACGESRAGEIDPGDEAALIGGIRGESRTGVGDVALYNCRVRFVIQGARVGNGYLPSGGSLIDADLVRAPGEAGWDAVDEHSTIFGAFRVFVADEVGVLADGSNGGPAIVRAIGTDGPNDLIQGAVGIPFPEQNLLIIQDYVLEPDSNAVRIDTYVTAVGPHNSPVPVGDFLMWSDHAVDPVMVGAGFDREGHNGFIPLIGACGEHNEVCYGAFSAERDLNLAVGMIISAFGGGGDFALYPYFTEEAEIATYETHGFSRYFAVGKDLAEVTAARAEIRGDTTVEVSGSVLETGTGAGVAGARVHLVETSGGVNHYATWAASAADGSWSARVPAGDYDITVTGASNGQDAELAATPPLPFPFADGRGRGDTWSGNVAADMSGVDLNIGPQGTATVTLLDETGSPAPGKVLFQFIGADPTPPDPMLGERNAYGFAPRVVWTIDGSYTFPIEPGTYDVTAAAGFTAEIDERPGEVVDPSVGPLSLTFNLPRVVDHTGWWAADNHLHAAPSMHGEATMEERVVTVAAEGLDFFISTDHDTVADYQPLIDQIGATAVLKNIVGEEISPIWAHFNAFPLVRDDSLPNGGAVPWWQGTGMPLSDIVDWALGTLQAGVIQINHGRSPGYFDASGFDPITGSIGNPERFDDRLMMMEVANGKSVGNREALIVDFYALLNLGYPMVGTGTSDAHGLLGGEPGMHRSYYNMPAVASPADINGAEVIDAANGGRLLISGGPLPLVDIDGSLPGSVVTPAPGAGLLNIEVRAPSWIEVTTITIVANGAVLDVFTVDPGAVTPPVWFSTAYPLNPSVDTWYVVRVDGGSLTPIYPGANAFALSNPIYLDLDGDGFDAPGP